MPSNTINRLPRSSEPHRGWRERTACVPDLWRHPYPQASVILGAARSNDELVWSRWSELWKMTNDLDESALSSSSMGQIGLWYDYSCMPQPGSRIDTQTTEANLDRRFRKALFELPDLLATCPIVILRTPDDDYGGHGWRGTEVSIDRDRGGILFSDPTWSAQASSGATSFLQETGTP